MGLGNRKALHSFEYSGGAYPRGIKYIRIYGENTRNSSEQQLLRWIILSLVFLTILFLFFLAIFILLVLVSSATIFTHIRILFVRRLLSRVNSTVLVHFWI